MEASSALNHAPGLGVGGLGWPNPSSPIRAPCGPVGRKNSIRIARTALPEAALDQAALPLNTFAENSRLYSPQRECSISSD
jgi:hypothetical protein